MNTGLTRLRTFRSECTNTSLVGTIDRNPTPNLLLDWRWKSSMTGRVSIFAVILLARYLLLIDSQLGLLPLFTIPACNSGEVVLSNHSGTRLSGSNLAPSHLHDTWPTICSIYDFFFVYSSTVCLRKKLSKCWRHVAQKVTRIWQYQFYEQNPIVFLTCVPNIRKIHWSLHKI